MEKRELQKLLSQPYSQENWKQIVQFVFPNVSIRSTPYEYEINDNYVKKFRQIGDVKLDDGKNLALFELILAKNIDLKRNRVGLNDRISKYIDQEGFHGVLSVFDQQGEDYRFTFSSKSTDYDADLEEIVQSQTDKKRFTYVLGKNQSCKTPAERFYSLSQKDEIKINNVIDAFNVENLSKEFFDKYKKQFEKFWKYIASKEEYKGVFINGQGDREVKIRNFTKKLLGRIVFLHFLQKKGWMGCPENESWGTGDKKFMQTLFKDFTNKEQFHSQCLVELFYNTLNTKRDNFLFKCDGLEGILNNSKIPYLNGGLFDSDRLESTKIDFPESYFQDLFDFFGQYNFTIDENDPNDHEVGIDPEMLGHIFENLLEDNKDKGAFYTPKVIVQYMCQESLIEYLATKLEAETSVEVKQAIEDLIRNRLREDISDLDLVEPIAQALFDVKICDPAIGSGAFPMGILNVIYQVIEALYYLQPDSVARVWNISDIQWQPHLVKKNIIQHSIYGVDIESGAVDIARLRFWLALVVDEVEPLPLPNLDYKIMQGNSLLESFEGIDLSQISDAAAYEAVYESEQIDMFSGEAKKKVSMFLQFEDVKTLMDDYFNANDPETKKDLHKRIDVQVLNHIRFTLAEHKRELQKKAKKLQKKVSLDEDAARTWEQKEKIRTNSKASKELVKLNAELSQYNNKELKLAQLSNSYERPFFLWHLFFQEVFDKGGFDVVIGNPPYISLESNPEISNSLENKGFETYAKRGDIYCVFYEKGLNIIKEKGILTYITSNKWMTAAYGKRTRKFLLRESNPKNLIDFKETLLFDTATVFTNILITKKEHNCNELLACIIGNDYKLKDSINDFFNKNYVSAKNLDDGIWVIASKKELLVRNKIEAKSKSLLDLGIFISSGQKTGCNDAFIISEQQKNELLKISSKYSDRIKPILRGRQISQYEKHFSEDYLIISPYNMHKNLIDEYPALFNHLNNFKQTLENRGQVLNGQHHWLELDNNPTLNALLNYEKPKIIWKEISASASFCYDDENYYLPNTSYFLLGEDLYFLLGVLNSSLSDFYFFQITPQIAGGSKRYTKQYVELLRIPNFESSLKNKISTIVKQIINYKKNNLDDSDLKMQIDILLMEFYELDDEQKKLIFKNTNN